MLRQRLGALDTMCRDVYKQRKGSTQWSQPDWNSDKWIDLLYTSIKDNKHPPELLLGLVETAQMQFWALTKPEYVVDASNSVCRALSRKLRTKFGVFEDVT